MFSIRSRLAGDNHILKNISPTDFEKEYDGCDLPGFVEMRFGSHTVGSWLEGPLHPEVFGLEHVDWWVSCLLDTLLLFEAGKTYASFYIFEHENTWLEFRRDDAVVIINEIYRMRNKPVAGYFLSEQDASFRCIEPADYRISYVEFKDALLRFAQSFLLEVEALNPRLYTTKRIRAICNQIGHITSVASE